MTDIAELAIRVNTLELEKANRTLKQTDDISRKVVSGIKLLASGFLAIKLKNLIFEATTLNQRYQELGVSMRVVGNNVGISGARMEATAVSIQKMGISLIKSRESVLKLAAAHIDLKEAEKLADLARNAAIRKGGNTSEALNSIIEGVQRGEIELLKTLGIMVSFENAYKKLAGEIGTTASALTLAQKQQARLNEVYDKAPGIVGLYTAAMGNAGKQFRSTDRLVENLKVRLGGLFDEAAKFLVAGYTAQLKELDGTVNELVDNNEFQAWGDNVARVFAFISDRISNLGAVFRIVGNSFAAVAAQAVALVNLDFDAVANINEQFNLDLNEEIAGLDKYTLALEAQIIERDLLTESVTGYAAKLATVSEEEEEAVEVNKDLVKQQGDFVENLKDEIAGLGKTTFEVRKLEAAKLGLLGVTEPLIDELERETNALQKTADDLAAIESITKSVRTEQEKYADDVAELDRLLGEGLGVEAHRRKVKELSDEFENVEGSGKSSIDAIEQAWTQGLRNIQSKLADGLFNFFDDGLKGMLDNVLSTVGRIGSEFAAIGILQGVGLGRGGSGGGGGGFSIGGALNAGSNLFSGITGGASKFIGGGINSVGNFLGSKSISQFGSGFAGTGAGAFSNLGGAGTAFIGGPGTAIGGSGLGGAAGIGATASSLLGPVAIAAAVDFGLQKVFGDKKLGGAAGDILSFVPVIGTLINGLFGRSPEKFNKQFGQLQVDSDGVTGSFTDEFRAKGSVFSKSKHRRTESSNSSELVAVFDNVIDGFIDSTTAFAENLGLTTGSIDDLAIKVFFQGKNKQRISEEQITEEIGKIQEQIAKNLLPTIDTFKRTGEDYIDTLDRINNEFSVLADLGNALGNSTASVRAFLQAADIGDRSSFVEAAGGIDVLSQKVSFVAENFLTDAERLAPVSELLAKTLDEVGISSTITKDQFGDLIQSFGHVDGISESLLQTLLELAPSILAIRNAEDQLAATRKKAAGDNVNKAFNTLQKTVDEERNRITAEYSKNIQTATDAIQTLTTLSNALKTSLNDINPQSIGEARSKLREAIVSASRGNVIDLKSIQTSIATVSGDSSSRFGSLAEFQSSQAESSQLLRDLGLATENQLSIEERNLVALESGFETELARLDSVIEQAERQSGLLEGINLSLAEIISLFNLRSQQNGGAGGIQGGSAAGNPDVSDSEINSFTLQSGITPDQIYIAAKKHGISAVQLAEATRFSLDDINEFTSENGLDPLRTGTNFVPRNMPAFLHKGEEVKPKAFVDSDKSERIETNILLKELIVFTQRTADLLDSTTGGGGPMLTRATGT